MRLTGLTIFLLIICIPASFITGWLANDGWRSIKAIGEAMEQNLQIRSSGEAEKVADNTGEVSGNNDPTLDLRVLETIENARVTAYTTRPEEGTNCISASGKNLCKRHDDGENIIACPSKYPFGTIVEIPFEVMWCYDECQKGIEYREYICYDRMALGLQEKNWFDIYMGRGEDEVIEAGLWGVRTLDIKIYE